MTGPKIAYFVTAHGFGHGARCAAVLNQLFALAPNLELHLYTSLPDFLIRQSVPHPYQLHPQKVDLGLAQLSPVAVDLPGSLRLYQEEYQPLMDCQEQIARELRAMQIQAVVCDISPLGLGAAKEAGIPSILVENFTWSWILKELAPKSPELARWAEPLEDLFAQADYRLRCMPYCGPLGQGHHEVGPVYREPRATQATIREQLGLSQGQKLVFLTFGGWIGEPVSMAVPDDYLLVVPGDHAQEITEGNRRYLPWESRFYHPDLMLAADLVICKLGYSTVVEAWRGRTAMLYLGRPDFPESPVLESFVSRHLAATETTLGQLSSGGWVRQFDRLSWPESPDLTGEPGAVSIANSILNMIHERCSKKENPGCR